MKQLLIIALCLSSSIAFGQSKQKIKFSNITSVGLLSGSSQNAFTLQTINGIKMKKWLFGIGVGVDNYGTKSVPVFVDVRKKFGNKQWQPLIYADAGIDCPLYQGNFSGKATDGNDKYKLYNNLSFEAGLGFTRSITTKLQLNLNLGFSYKNLSYLEHYSFNSPVVFYDRIPNPIDTRYDFYYKRLALRLGLQF